MTVRSTSGRHLFRSGLLVWLLLSAVVARRVPGADRPPRGSPHRGAPRGYSIGRQHVTPGGLVRFPLRVRSAVPLTLVSWSLEFDPTVVELLDVSLRPEIRRLLERVEARIDGFESHFEWFVDQDEGWLQASLTFDFEGRELFSLPADSTIALAEMIFRVSDDAAPGHYPIAFTEMETARFEGHFRDAQGPVFNRCRRPGRAFDRDSRFDGEEVHRTENEDGVLSVSIIGDVGIFVRGDTNLDLEVDIADPIKVLDYLFRGGEELECPEAADANRDGAIDLSDPITILVYLFISSPTWEPTTEPVSGGSSSAGLGCSL